MEEKNTPSSSPKPELFPHLTNSKDVLNALTQTLKAAYAPSSEAPADQGESREELVRNFYRKARELGASSYEIAEAAMRGMPKDLQQRYFSEIERNNIYGNPTDASLTPQEVFALKEKFTLLSSSPLEYPDDASKQQEVSSTTE